MDNHLFLGVSEFDDDHSKILNDLDAILSATNSRAAIHRMEVLCHNWMLHIMMEEKYLMEIGYDRVAQHLVSHSNITELGKKIKTTLRQCNDIRIVKSEMQFLSDVIKAHIDSEDRKYVNNGFEDRRKPALKSE